MPEARLHPAPPPRREPRRLRGSRLALARLAVGLAAGLAACGPPAAGDGDDADQRRPSVLLISIDTLRADHMGLYGYERDTTPYLDRLSEESIVFERAFAPASWTLISHMTMLTGLYPNQHGVVNAETALNPTTPLLAEELRDLGYQTVGLYFEGWIHERHGFDRGFDVFRAHDDASEAGRHLEEALAGLDPERPFFLFLHLFDVHSGPLAKEPGPVYHCPPPYDEMFLEDAAARLPDVPEGDLWISTEPLSPDALAGLTALYDGGIRYVDDTLSEWIGALGRDGWLEDTLLIVTADHGESLGQRGTGIRDHGGAYQEGIRVPLIVRLPGSHEERRAGERVTAPVSLADVVPTVLEVVGAPRGADGVPLPGQSLLGELPSERTVYGLSPETYEILLRWPEKLVWLKQRDLRIRVDLANDPEEHVGHPIPSEEFERARQSFLENVGDADDYPAPVELEDLPEEQQRRLRELGYAGGDE